MNYKDYLSGSHWRKFRKQALDHYGMKCVDCGEEKGRFDIHHLTYERFGKEELSDVVVLCHHCHYKRHEREPKIYDMRPYLCDHKKLSPASTTVGGEIFFYWQCRECYTLFPREPTEKENLRIEIHKQKYEEWLKKDLEKKKNEEQIRIKKLALKKESDKLAKKIKKAKKKKPKRLKHKEYENKPNK